MSKRAREQESKRAREQESKDHSLGSNESTGRVDQSLGDLGPEDVVLEGVLAHPLDEGLELLLDLLLPGLGGLGVTVDAEAFLGNVLELLAFEPDDNNL